jgi:hypothetical protein
VLCKDHRVNTMKVALIEGDISKIDTFFIEFFHNKNFLVEATKHRESLVDIELIGTSSS